MNNDLNGEIEALGIRTPEGVSAPSAAQEIRRIASEFFDLRSVSLPDIGRSAILDEAVEVYVELCRLSVQIGHQIARHGVEIARIKYQHDFQRPCGHHQVEVDEGLVMLRCKTCGASVNALWWMHQHATELGRSQDWKLSLDKDIAKTRKEIGELNRERSKVKQAVRRGKTTKAYREGADSIAPKTRKK